MDLATGDKFDLIHRDCNTQTGYPCGGAYQPAWSPDGTEIAVVFRWPGGTLRFGLHGIRLADGVRDYLIGIGDATPPENPAWSPDGKKIAFGYGGLIQVLTIGTGVKTLVPTGKMPAWSPRIEDPDVPDLYRIAYVALNPYEPWAGEDIFTTYECEWCATGPGEPTRQPEPGRDCYPSWSADGTRILYQGESDKLAAGKTGFDLFIMVPTTSTTRRST
jgi:dipeptidyl aminopeptidase/acylaminoacyl peptidase